MTTFFTQTTFPSDQPISRSEAKLFCRIDTDTEDKLVDALINTASMVCRDFLHRPILDTDYQFTSTNQDINIQLVPGTHLDSIVIKYYNTDKDEITSDLAGSSVGFQDNFLVISVKENVKTVITLTAGFGPSIDTIPLPVKNGMLLLVEHYYSNKSSANAALPAIVKSNWYPYRYIVV